MGVLAKLVAAALECVAQAVAHRRSGIRWHRHVDDLQQQVTLGRGGNKLHERVAAIAHHRNQFR